MGRPGHRSVVVSEKPSFYTIFIDAPELTVVGYIWVTPPAMPVSFVVIQPVASEAVYATARKFMCRRCGCLSPVATNGDGTSTFRVTFAETGETNPVKAVAEYGAMAWQLFDAMT